MPEEPKASPKNTSAAVGRAPIDSSHIPWIAARPRSHSMSDAQFAATFDSRSPLRRRTAKGGIVVLADAPAVLSEQMRCIRDGYNFVWRFGDMFRFSPQMSNMLHRLFLVASQGQGRLFRLRSLQRKGASEAQEKVPSMTFLKLRRSPR